MGRPIELDRTCSTCDHYDGDHYCALPMVKRQVTGWIAIPDGVVCVQHEPRLTMQEQIDKDAADEERSLYRHARY